MTVIPHILMSSTKMRLLTIALAMAALLSAFAAVGDYFTGDLFLARAIQGVRFGPVQEAMQVVSYFGKTLPLLAVALAVFLWSLRKQLKPACLVALGAILSFGTSPILKFMVDRPRPSTDLVAVWRYHESLSFPSGHVFNTTILFGLLFYLAPMLFPWKPVYYIVRGMSLSLIFLTGLSRVYLGAHWPSDVLGGFLFGALVLALLITIHRLLVKNAQGVLPQAA